MKKPFISDRNVQIYVSYLEAKLEKYNHETEKAELFLALKKQIGEITEVLYVEKAVIRKKGVEGGLIINESIIDISKDITKITKQMDELQRDLDEELLEKVERSLKSRSSIKGEYSPEDFAERYRKLKRGEDEERE